MSNLTTTQRYFHMAPVTLEDAIASLAEAAQAARDRGASGCVRGHRAQRHVGKNQSLMPMSAAETPLAMAAIIFMYALNFTA